MSILDGDLDDVLADAYTWAVRADSWLGGRWLGQVPVAGGSVSWTTGQQVQGTLSLTVPRVAPPAPGMDEVDFTPVTDDAPLACMGQELRVTAFVTSPVTPGVSRFALGRFLVTGWDIGARDVTVSGKSLLQRVEDDRLTAPVAPRASSTLGSEARRLLGGHVGLLIDSHLTDRACPLSMSWGESRLDGVYEIADAWPARLRESRDGVVHLLPPAGAINEPPARRLTDGARGTVIGAKSSASRDKIYNVVVARSQDNTEGNVPAFQAVAVQETGPMAAGGPWGRRVKFFSSKLITSQTAAQSTADAMLREAISAARKIPVELPPDPTIELDDPVSITSATATGAAPVTAWGRVAAVEIPLAPTGTTRIDVEVDS